MVEMTLLPQGLWTLQSQAAMATGEMSWDLGSRTRHDAGATLNVNFRIRNITDAAKQYRIYFGLFDISGPVLATWVSPEVLAVAATGEEIFILAVPIGYSDCILQASLYDPDSGSMGATLQTVLEQSEEIIEGGLGSLSWNLPQVLQFAAGSSLSVTFKVSNPSTIDRNYHIYRGLFDKAGPAITSWVLPGEIAVAASDWRQVPASLNIDCSNCILQASLYNVETGGMSVALQATLDPPPGIGERMEPVVAFASGIMALGLVAGMAKSIRPI